MCLKMLGNRRNLIFRVSIVINIAVLLYAAMQLSANVAPGVEWVPLTVDGSERSAGAAPAEFRFSSDGRNYTETRPQESSVLIIEESTSQKTPSTMPTINKTASSTASTTELVKKALSESPADFEALNETLEVLDEKLLSDATLSQLRTLLRCNDRDFLPQTMQRGEYWVLKNYVQAEHGPLMCHESVTYTTHAGFEFLDNMEPLVKRWMGPISLAIYTPGNDLIPTIKSIRYLRDCTSTDYIKQFVTFHIFFSARHVPNSIPDSASFLSKPFNCSNVTVPPYIVNTSTTYMKQNNLLYPVNIARNIAREAALTHYILPSDIELYPSPNLIARFLNMIARNEKPLNTSTHPKVFPLSIFEVSSKVHVPLTKSELQAMLVKKTAIPFHKYVCPNCHNIPQGKQWMDAKETDQMNVFHVGKRRGRFVHWEPIFIGTHQDPYYDDRLSWEGKQDKMTQGYVLCVKDYDFMILNNAFLTHKPGIKRLVKNKKRDLIASRQSAYIAHYILPELKKLYGTKGGCAL